MNKIIKSGHNVAHGLTTEPLWPVQARDVIALLESKLEQTELSKDFNHEHINCSVTRILEIRATSGCLEVDKTPEFRPLPRTMLQDSYIKLRRVSWSTEFGRRYMYMYMFATTWPY